MDDAASPAPPARAAWDPEIYLVLPGSNGQAATTRAHLGPCPMCSDGIVFDVVLNDNGRYSCQCPSCCRRNGRVVGKVDMITFKAWPVREGR